VKSRSRYAKQHATVHPSTALFQYKNDFVCNFNAIINCNVQSMKFPIQLLLLLHSQFNTFIFSAVDSVVLAS